jgi:hypothetical protein
MLSGDANLSCDLWALAHTPDLEGVLHLSIGVVRCWMAAFVDHSYILLKIKGPIGYPNLNNSDRIHVKTLRSVYGDHILCTHRCSLDTCRVAYWRSAVLRVDTIDLLIEGVDHFERDSSHVLFQDTDGNLRVFFLSNQRNLNDIFRTRRRRQTLGQSAYWRIEFVVVELRSFPLLPDVAANDESSVVTRPVVLRFSESCGTFRL